MDKRIHWVDIAKGLLILMVVWGHINYVSVLVLGKACFVDVERTTSLYFPWYMAVFFCITGYCTNYRKPFLKFFKEKFKSLIIPNVLLGSMLFVPQSIMLGQPLESVIAGCIRNIFLYGGSYWFLTALFIADIIFYWILRLTDKRLLQLMILGILYLIGTVSFVYHVPNLMNFENAFALTGCLFLGMFFKQNNKFISDKRWALAIGGATELVILLLITSGIQNPSVVSSIYICKFTLPLLPILMFGGSCLIIYLAKLIKINRMLECLGRNSLMIYLFHFIFLQALIKFICKDIELSVPFSFVMAVLLSLVSVALSVFCGNLVNKKLSFLIGKF